MERVLVTVEPSQPMIPTTFLNISLISAVPCSAVGASAYIGYQYYITNSSIGATEDVNALNSEALASLSTKQIQLKTLQTELQITSDLLKVEEPKRLLLIDEQTHYEIALLTKTKEDIETKRAAYIKDELAKTSHESSIAALKTKKEDAATEKGKKEALVTTKKQEITEATNKHQEQEKKEVAAKSTFDDAVTALTTATTNHETQKAKELVAQNAFNANATSKTDQDAAIKVEEAKEGPINTRKTEAESNRVAGKKVCDAAVKAIEDTKNCDDTTSTEVLDTQITSAFTTYDALTKTVKDIEQELTTLKGKIAQLKEALKVTESETQGLTNTLNTEKTESERLRVLKTEAQTKKDQAETLHTKSKALTAQLLETKTKAEGELAPLEADLKTATSTLEGLEKELTQLNQQTSEINSSYEASKKALAVIIGEITDKAAAIQTTNAKLQVITDEINEKKTSLSSTTTTPVDLSAKNKEQLEQSITTYKDNIKLATNKIQTIKDKIELLTSQLNALTLDIEQSSKEVVVKQVIA